MRIRELLTYQERRNMWNEQNNILNLTRPKNCKNSTFFDCKLTQVVKELLLYSDFEFAIELVNLTFFFLGDHRKMVKSMPCLVRKKMNSSMYCTYKVSPYYVLSLIPYYLDKIHKCKYMRVCISSLCAVYCVYCRL